MDTWLATNIFFSIGEPVTIYGFATSRFAHVQWLLHLEYQRVKLVSLFMTYAYDRSIILMLYATYIFCNYIIIKTDQIIYVILFLIFTQFMVSLKRWNTKNINKKTPFFAWL